MLTARAGGAIIWELGGPRGIPARSQRQSAKLEIGLRRFFSVFTIGLRPFFVKGHSYGRKALRAEFTRPCSPLPFYEERVTDLTYSRNTSERPRRERRSPAEDLPRPRRTRRGPGPSGGTVAALIILGAAALSVVIVAAAVLRVGGGSPDPAVPAMGAVSRTEAASWMEEGAPVQGREVLTASGYRQLSDPLLVLVNDAAPLPEDWQVTPAFIGDETVDQRCYSDLDAMFQAAQEENVWLWVASGYRSVEDQEEVLQREITLHMSQDGMTREEAQETSLKTIARPGYSEHHTGLAVDLNDVSDNFEATEEYKWLKAHAPEYGFVQRYRSDKVDKTGIDNESWHYRYVGREHAQEMERLDMCLEEYVEYLKGQGVA